MTRLIETIFNYDSPTSSSQGSRHVLVTSENQYEVRGFALDNLTAREIQSIQKAWNGIAGQRWSTQTKERIALRRSGVSNAFRSYKKSFMSNYYKRSDI